LLRVPLPPQPQERVFEGRALRDADRLRLFETGNGLQCIGSANAELIAAAQQTQELQRLLEIEEAAGGELDIDFHVARYCSQFPAANDPPLQRAQACFIGWRQQAAINPRLDLLRESLCQCAVAGQATELSERLPVPSAAEVVEERRRFLDFNNLRRNLAGWERLQLNVIGRAQFGWFAEQANHRAGQPFVLILRHTAQSLFRGQGSMNQ
jgi:hypothetical protein